MIPEFEELIALRIPSKDAFYLDQIVQEGKFKNRSSVIRQAIKEVIKKAALDDFLNQLNQDCSISMLHGGP
jgi:Arc/MetJ-type ribon-helix-helix transcriptional regulator